MSGRSFEVRAVCQNQVGTRPRYGCAFTRAMHPVITPVHPAVAECDGLHVVASGDIQFAGVKSSEVAANHVGAVHLAPPLAGAAGWKNVAENIGALYCCPVSTKLRNWLVFFPLGHSRFRHPKEQGKACVVRVQRFSGLAFSDVHAWSLARYTEMSSTLNSLSVKLTK